MIKIYLQQSPQLKYSYLQLPHECHDTYSPLSAGVVDKQQDKRLPDPNGPLFSIIPAEAIRDAINTHGQSIQVQGVESKQRLHARLQAQITKYALANGSYHYR